MIGKISTTGIKFYRESDGDPHRQTHYIIAQSESWSDDKRLDCNSRTQSVELCRSLKSGELTMEGAEAFTGSRWL